MFTVRKPGEVAMSPRFLVLLLGGLAVGLVGLGGLIWVVTNRSIEQGEAFARATAFARSSPDVQARVGALTSTALASGESSCQVQSEIPPSGNATFTVLVTGTAGHAKLDVWATRNAQGWRLAEAKVRPTDDGPFAVARGCEVHPDVGGVGTYGKGG